MNIFWLSLLSVINDEYHANNAAQHSDKHVTVSAKEALQMLYTALWALEPNGSWRDHAPYNLQKTRRGFLATHTNVTIVKWVRETLANYLYTANYALALCKEYTKRFHKVTCMEAHAVYLRDNPPAALPDLPMTPIPLVIGVEPIPREENLEIVVQRYRKYYAAKGVVKYAHTPMPEWLAAELK